MAVQLSTLQPIELREAWPHEALNFTPWLADNLHVLSDLLGMELELISTEHPVGSFNLDIYAKDLRSDEVVAIENQLERTDHTHLGQVMTYFSALEARKVIWIAKEIREEHRAVISWLNAHTQPEYAFFGVEVSTVRIADSPIAPVFTVVEKPNNWVRSIQQRSTSTSQETAERNQAFWQSAVEQDQELEGIYPEGVGPYASNHWLAIPRTYFILSLALTRDGVGWFVRGQLGSKDEETAAALGDHFSLLQQKLSCVPNKPYLSRWLKHDWSEPNAQSTLLEWLVAEKQKVLAAFADLSF
ncbi:DUF4268 domain-containing protein [Synechococcus sp. NOUM97013]|uniref:DUF4268 domain-containing protein n=1 Tax=Synechococcus sp. NOUM97013 TaxID=1442555 RepID=UPI001647DDCF|nr:DUF4268 domain-containing protein [Synechococcus sp. NOUM97013]QNI73796.1 hypothetical protein SynNOUM97013_01739 [Synechococcus sp. NOUM97013]